MARRKDEWTPISVEVGEVAYHCHYQTESGMTRVKREESSKTTQTCGSPPKALARLILSELVREHQD